MNNISISVDLPSWFLIVLSISLVMIGVAGVANSYMDYKISKAKLELSRMEGSNE